MRTHLSLIITRVETRIAELGGDGALAAAKADTSDPDLDPAAVTDEATVLDGETGWNWGSGPISAILPRPGVTQERGRQALASSSTST